MIRFPMFLQGATNRLVSSMHIQGLNDLKAVQVEIDQMPMGYASVLLSDTGPKRQIQSVEIRAMLADRKRKDLRFLLSVVLTIVCGCLTVFGLSRL